MYNRKFNIKKDYDKLLELEDAVLPLLRSVVKDDAAHDALRDYIRRLFNNQFKK